MRKEKKIRLKMTGENPRTILNEIVASVKTVERSNKTGQGGQITRIGQLESEIFGRPINSSVVGGSLSGYEKLNPTRSGIKTAKVVA